MKAAKIGVMSKTGKICRCEGQIVERCMSAVAWLAPRAPTCDQCTNRWSYVDRKRTCEFALPK